MNISAGFEDGKRTFRCEYVSGISFTDAASLDKCAQLPVICAGFERLQDKSILFGRMKCLSLHCRLT